MDKRLNVLPGKAHGRPHQHFVVVIERAKAGAAKLAAGINSETEPAIEEIGSVQDKTLWVIVQIESDRNWNRRCTEGYCAGDFVAGVHPGISGEKFPFGGLCITGAGARRRGS